MAAGFMDRSSDELADEKMEAAEQAAESLDDDMEFDLSELDDIESADEAEDLLAPDSESEDELGEDDLKIEAEPGSVSAEMKSIDLDLAENEEDDVEALLDSDGLDDLVTAEFKMVDEDADLADDEAGAATRPEGPVARTRQMAAESDEDFDLAGDDDLVATATLEFLASGEWDEGR